MVRRTGYVVMAAVAALAAALLFQQNAAAQRAAQFPSSGPGPGAGPTYNQGPGPGNGYGRGDHGPALPRWEYATLRFDIVRGDWVWHSPEGVKRGDKRQLYREMGGYGRRDNEVSYVDISTQAGQYGWEITTVLEREKGTEIWFKRPVR